MKKDKTMGWEVARDIEKEKQTIFERFIPEWRHLKAAFGGIFAFFLVFLIGIWLAGNPFGPTERIQSDAIIARGLVGNVVGADVLNCLFVIGAASVASPLAIPTNFFTFHFPTMLIILYSFSVFIFISKGVQFRRWHGAWLLGVYLIYVAPQYYLNVGTVQS